MDINDSDIVSLSNTLFPSNSRGETSVSGCYRRLNFVNSLKFCCITKKASDFLIDPIMTSAGDTFGYMTCHFGFRVVRGSSSSRLLRKIIAASSDGVINV